MRKVLALVVLVTSASLLTGCGNRPSEDELAEALRDPSNVISVTGVTTDEETIDCIAEALHDSDVSDESLRAVVENDMTWDGDEDNADAIADLTGEVAACVVKHAPGVAS